MAQEPVKADHAEQWNQRCVCVIVQGPFGYNSGAFNGKLSATEAMRGFFSLSSGSRKHQSSWQQINKQPHFVGTYLFIILNQGKIEALLIGNTVWVKERILTVGRTEFEYGVT